MSVYVECKKDVYGLTVGKLYKNRGGYIYNDYGQVVKITDDIFKRKS